MSDHMDYLDLQALAGVTKHHGGYPATHQLLEMCHITEGMEVLEIGCGIGVGAVNLARNYGVRVVATDLSEKMLDWARKRVAREGVANMVEFQQADVLELPFRNDRFDAVISESVLAFVDDKPKAMAEMRRVCKPGGYVGVNEACWLEEPPADLLEKATTGSVLGIEVLTTDAWRELWPAPGLEEPEVREFKLDPATELRSRLKWIGWRQVLGAQLRTWPMYLRHPEMRNTLRQLSDSPKEFATYMGYVLMSGRKPVAVKG